MENGGNPLNESVPKNKFSSAESSCILPTFVNDCTNLISDSALPLINDCSSSFRGKRVLLLKKIESKNNESLLKSLRKLQNRELSELKYNRKSAFENKDVNINFSPQVSDCQPNNADRKTQRNKKQLSVCPFTEDKYINDVYVK